MKHMFPFGLDLGRTRNPYSMTDAYNHALYTPGAVGVRGGQRAGMFSSAWDGHNLGVMRVIRTGDGRVYYQTIVRGVTP